MEFIRWTGIKSVGLKNKTLLFKNFLIIKQFGVFNSHTHTQIRIFPQFKLDLN